MTSPSRRLIGALAVAGVLGSLPVAVAGQAPRGPATRESARKIARHGRQDAVGRS